MARRQHSRPGRGELDRERQTVEPAADLRDRVEVLGSAPAEPRHRRRPGQGRASPHRLPERLHGEHLLAGEVEDTTARDDKGEPGAPPRRSRSKGPASIDMLEVVEHDQQLAVGDRRRRSSLERLARLFHDAERGGDCGITKAGSLHGSQLDERDAVGEEACRVGGQGERQAVSCHFRRRPPAKPA